MRIVSILILGLLLCTTSCTFSKELEDGHKYDCVGLDRDEDKNSNVVYKRNTVNIILGAIFFETIIAPVYVILEAWDCPVRLK